MSGPTVVRLSRTVYTLPEGERLLGLPADRARLWLDGGERRGVAHRPHDLRDTAASLMIASGANIKSVQRHLGHASATMILERYGYLYWSPTACVSRWCRSRRSTRVDVQFCQSHACILISEKCVVCRLEGWPCMS